MQTVYVDWRRELAGLEEKYRFVEVTPYEKNIEIWRQLWMVIERSDILVQIVDCRDPLFFRCADLEAYVKEVGSRKVNFLLLNKADLLREELRKLWSDYFNAHGISHIFFSAKEQQNKIDKDIVDNTVESDFSKLINTSSVVNRTTLMEILKSVVKSYRTQKPQEAQHSKPAQPSNPAQPEQQLKQSAEQTEASKSEKPEQKTSKVKLLKVVPNESIQDKPVVNLWEAIYNHELKEEAECEKECGDDCKNCEEMCEKKPINEEDDENEWQDDDLEGEEEEGEEEETEPEDVYKRLGVDKDNLVSTPFYDKKEEDRVVIGMIGFPNVGKSSVINVLCNKKLVGVGSRPGKTKNFQTIFLEKDLVLCDCPGLVFPDIVHSKAEMICNSVIPIDNLKEYMSPMALVCSKIPVRALEYTLKCPMFQTTEYMDAPRMLHYFAKNRGMISGSGMPNYAEAAKVILKKLVAGELLLASLPPEDFLSKPSEHIKVALFDQTLQYHSVPQDFEQSNPDSIPTELERERIQEDRKTETGLDKDFFRESEDIEEKLAALSQDDVFDLVMGKRVNGFKLEKEQRRELKFAIKRDAETEEIFGMLASYMGRDRKGGFVSIKKPGGQL